jgi:DNA-binding GntR family transcriptional regulator
MRQQVVEAVLADVFQGRLKAGQHLITQELAERFQVSHTPVREALITLAGMGIVDWQPNRGATVRQVTRRDVEEICQVRRLLECAATRRACGRIGLRELQGLRDEFCRLAAVPVRTLSQRNARRFIDAARRADSRLHDLIAASCGNAFLAQELDRLKLLFRVFRDCAWQEEEARHDYRRLADEASEHLAIVEALIAKDAQRAAKAMAQHIRAGARYWGRSLLLPFATSAQNGTYGEHPSGLVTAESESTNGRMQRKMNQSRTRSRVGR